ncbi:hypothetical protein, partial [Flavihumibacter cheonanensis]|uniref:hypothetical protein n=1 Tax=Flavihumibacter cheonanensis TaxID=1442385 RepID=UPI001EF7E684
MEKLGCWISPLDVVENGNRSLHAIQSGVRVDHGKTRLCIESLDAHLVSPGKPQALPLRKTQPDLSGG